ncbi:ribose-phosphate pyrophosphokinase [Erythrobacter sp. KMU-140]|uniref:Ribose-phosphate pyrophosphokinase n=1 Tax=Erythrobacter rubeus TaxID=2760803 RepID=A0ABR8KV89_9SPHN|nr:ribose-phosphate pyrophosphokinase [Erythrobacter rubeus]
MSEPEDWSAIHDTQRIRALLLAAAREERAVSYSEILGQLGFRFTRPKMRALCRTLDAIDADGRARGEPELAVLVVRESDGLPGQGWWTGRKDYSGEWTGEAARRFVRKLQRAAFKFWR